MGELCIHHWGQILSSSFPDIESFKKGSCLIARNLVEYALVSWRKEIVFLLSKEASKGNFNWGQGERRNGAVAAGIA
jgi:hypothetical protein